MSQIRSRFSAMTLAAIFFFAATSLMASPAPLEVVLSVDNAATNPGDVAWVRVLHASPDAPAVDVWVDGSVAFPNVAFQDVTAYAALPGGMYRVQVEPAGSGGQGPFVIDAMVDVQAGVDYTVAASGFLSEIAPIILIDDNSAPAADSARIRAFHGSPDAPAVDIAVANGGPILFPNVPFGLSGAIEVPADTYDLEIRVTGTDTVVLTIPGVAVEAGTVYSAYATGLVADGSADRTAYLLDERFRVDVSWEAPDARTGSALISELQDRTASFFFFAHDNFEAMVKVLDGRSTNGYFWVFYGALSNVAYDITVTDTETGDVWTLTNPQGQFSSGADTQAFLGE